VQGRCLSSWRTERGRVVAGPSGATDKAQGQANRNDGWRAADEPQSRLCLWRRWKLAGLEMWSARMAGQLQGGL